MGLVKFDLLGLGMLAALQYCFDLIARAHRRGVGARDHPEGGEGRLRHALPRRLDRGVPGRVPRADGAAAAPAAAPVLRPRGRDRAHPARARSRAAPCTRSCAASSGEEQVTYLHPKLEPVLERTLGIPVFQEQLMQMAMAVGELHAARTPTCCAGRWAPSAGSSGSSRCARSSTRAWPTNGSSGEVADAIYAKIQAFANFGFAESHSLSFGLLVYASSWIKLHYPAAFLAALLRAQPMGFYSPQTLTADARRHGVEVLRPDILRSGVEAGLEPVGRSVRGASRRGIGRVRRPPRSRRSAGSTAAPPTRRRTTAATARSRCGWGSPTSPRIGTTVAERIVAEREARGPYRDMATSCAAPASRRRSSRRSPPRARSTCFGLQRREALWLAGSAAAGPRGVPRRLDRRRAAAAVRRCRPELRAGSRPTCGRRASPPTTTRSALSATGLDERGALTHRPSCATHETGRRIEVGGAGDAPAAAGDGIRHHVHEPRGRARHCVNVICWRRGVEPLPPRRA